MKIWFFGIVMMISVPVLAHWDLNDVSYLMPIPEDIRNTGLLHDNSTGLKGDLLSTQVLQSLPHLTSNNEPDNTKQGLQVLGLRIDPCFPQAAPLLCQKQIRMVWQPLEMSPEGGLRTADATLHSFYILTDDEFTSLLKDLLEWKQKFKVQTAGLPLNKHPAWTSSQDASLQDFNQIILKYAGSQNLSRVTVMALRSGGIMWHFLGFDIDSQGKMSPMIIPRLGNVAQQSFVNNAVPFTSFFGGFAPKPQGEDTINSIPRDSDIARKDQDLIKAEIGAAFRAENPDRHNPNTMDCMTCHIAQSVKTWGLRNFPQWEFEKMWDAVTYKNPRYDLANKSATWRTNNVRAFGYFDRDAYFSQRVINESAAVADALNLLMPQNP